MSSRLTDVAVGVLMTPDQQVLLASRPEGKPYAGWWEFPGGKLEAGETVAQALARELHEELHIDILNAFPWVTLEHVYDHAHVRLHFTRVSLWQGTPSAREGQQFGWFPLRGELPAPLLPATIPTLRWLQLPQVMGISYASIMGQAAFISAFERQLAQGLKALIVREPGWSDAQVETLLQALLPRAREHAALVLVSSRHAPALWQRAHGVHLRATDAAALNQRPDVEWVGVSVHEAQEIQQALALKADFCLLGSVLPTATHPGAPTLGWPGFVQTKGYNALPVYALGGLQRADLETAQAYGAHGIAMMRDLWKA
jgi:8-oxo-dGTP diphosphatase